MVLLCRITCRHHIGNAYWSVYDKLSRTVKYDAVYYLAGVDTYLEINYDQKDSCANVLLRQSDSAMSNSHDLLRIRKGGIGRTSYLPFQMLFLRRPVISIRNRPTVLFH